MQGLQTDRVVTEVDKERSSTRHSISNASFYQTIFRGSACYFSKILE
jgi:hypothetical protein